MTHFLYPVRHGEAAPHDGPLSPAAIDRFTRAAPEQGDNHELIVTHNLLIGWLVSQAMAAPSWRWLGLNQMNCALTVIAYRPGLPPALISFNDAGHLTLSSGGPASPRPSASFGMTSHRGGGREGGLA